MSAARDELDEAVFSVDGYRPAMPGPCIERVGTSQVAKMRVALGRRAWQLGDPDYIRRQAAVMKRSGKSRALLVAAGVLGSLKEDEETLDRGTRRESEIFATWQELLSKGWHSHPFEEQIDPSTIVWRPPPRPDDPRVIDRDCPELDSAGFDGDCLTYSSEVVAIDAKCARYKHPRAKFAGPVWWDRGVCPWWFEDQLTAIQSIRRVKHALLIVGGGWNRDDDDPRSDGPIRVFYVGRHEQRIAEVRAIARETVRNARAIRASAEKA